MNYAELMSHKMDCDNSLLEYTKEIITESERVAEIVKNLLTFSREEKEIHTLSRVDDIILDTVSLIKTVIKKNQIALNVDIGEDLPFVKCRSQQIRQVIMNLLTNAIDTLNLKYPVYHENKSINITAMEFKADIKNYLRLTIEDKGSGIAKELQTKIFDPFFTTKDRAMNSGLGLSISYGIVKDHNGNLSYETEFGNYTRFHLDLPIEVN